MNTVSGSLSDSEEEEEGLQIVRDDGQMEAPPAKMARLENKAAKSEKYSDFAAKMMAKMGYQEGKGLGKHEQGRVEIVEASKQRGRRGLGLTLQGFEPSEEVEWDFTDDHIIIDEEVDWLPSCQQSVPDIEEMRDWKVIGKKKLTIDDESRFCDPLVLRGVLSAKSVFDQLEGEELRRARTKSNPYETIRGAFFLNRAAMKMANMDAVLDFMFTNPKSSDGRPLLGHSDILYFSDICAGPGGFSEYILWRMHGDTKGFGMTLKGPCDFKLVDFYAGPPEMFEPHYGVGGAEGDGDIFRPDNQAEFINFVKENTDGKGVHFVMADGGFSVEGQENIQEILSKQLYLCQFLVALSILRPEGHFVCKLFDLFTPFSVGLVYLMYRAFDQVSIYKPVTSRPANSERYIVCKNLRSDADAVRQYMHEINLDLNKYSSSQSQQDVTEIVSPVVLENDTEFIGYMFDSNNILGQRQILNLRKIKAFTQNPDLRDDRQAETREKCLEKWKVPDDVRAAPPKQNPNTKIDELLQDSDTDFLYHSLEELTPDNLSGIKSPYNYRCYVVGGVERRRCYLLGLGRTHVFKLDVEGSRKWKKLSEDNLQIELPANTLMEVEFVQEMKGEGMGQKRLMTIHALDALFLYSKDVRKLHFNERMEKLKKFVKCITKPTRSDLTQIVVPYVYRLEEIHKIFEKLEFRRVKGSGNPRLCYFPPERVDCRCFMPSGVCIVKTVKEPWTIAWSRSQQRKYFFHLHNRESRFDCPLDSVATVSDCKKHSFIWKFEEGVKIHDQQNFKANPHKLSKDEVIESVQRLIHR